MWGIVPLKKQKTWDGGKIPNSNAVESFQDMHLVIIVWRFITKKSRLYVSRLYVIIFGIETKNREIKHFEAF